MSSIALQNDSTTPLDVRDFAMHDVRHPRRASRPTSSRTVTGQRVPTTASDRQTTGPRHGTPLRSPRPSSQRKTPSKDYPFSRTSPEQADPDFPDAQDPAHLNPLQHTHSIGDAKRGNSILLVEDNPINMKVSRHKLHKTFSIDSLTRLCSF